MLLSREIELCLRDFSHRQSRKEDIRGLLVLEALLDRGSSAEAGLLRIVRSLRRKLDREAKNEVTEVCSG
jgi:hypothetical protein